MSGSSLALDTNRAIAVLNGSADASAVMARFHDIALPVPVIAELRYGALLSTRSEQNLAGVERLVSRCRPLNATIATAEIYARLRVALRRKGRPIPENDLWIAAICVEHDVPLWTDDAHFAAVDALQLASF